ncbi:unnamed protein product [Caenorhabditis sp. 36 PRJEB53466]|nr:unnamed protein product [Caenorhabditis sp. 36 PRJEB53466]
MVDNEVFEINDFTIVTDMEHFAAAFEGILQKHDLFGRRPSSMENVNYRLLATETETVSIGDHKLCVQLFQYLTDSQKSSITTEDSKDVDHENSSIPPFAVLDEILHANGIFDAIHHLTIKFGVKECIIVSPTDSTGTLTDENQAATVLGTIKTVLHSSRCEIPVFCFIKDKSLNMLEGYASDGNTSINFSSVVLRNINRRHRTLADLLFLFKEHLGASTSAFHDEVRISSRFTHLVPIKELLFHRIHTVESFGNLASGPFSGLPFNVLKVTATWHPFRENSLTENHNHSDFDINFASIWSIEIIPAPGCLSGTFDEILGAYSDNRRKAIRTDLKCRDILGAHYTHRTHTNAFSKLTSNTASEVTFGEYKASGEEITNGPLSKGFVRAWVQFIFNEEGSAENLSHELNMLNVENTSQHPLSDDDYVINEQLGKLYNYVSSSSDGSFLAPYKAAKRNSTAWRLAVALTNARVLMPDQPRAEPQLWVEFLLRLREKYEKLETIEIVNNGIDHMQCSFSQKLQMLQLCINARQKRHKFFDLAHSASSPTDEFFDANETFNKLQISEGNNIEGRLDATKLNLIGNPAAVMYVPITQDACPMTDEMIDAQNEYLFSLDEEGRVNAQMELVRSDMQCFKCANPDAIFADFLRWHSPKDYDEKTGTISERMMIPDNVWVNAWETAPAIPAVNQARIFNDGKIAEEIFELFDNATIDRIREWIKPSVFAATLERLTEVEKSYGASEGKQNQRVKVAKMLATATINNSAKEYNEVAKYCSQVEMIHNMKIHLIQLFETATQKMHPPHPTQDEIRDAVKKLVNLAVWKIWEESNGRQKIFIVKPQDSIGRALAVIGDFDKLTEKQLIHGDRKEYIFTWNLKRPSTTTSPMVHRMYADLNADNHCLYFSTSKDSNFFNASYLL